jgi:hypothetical protein
MVSKHSKLTKRQAQNYYGWFASPSSRTAPPPSGHEVGSSSSRHTAPPPSHHKVANSSHHCTAPPPSRMQEVGCSAVAAPLLLPRARRRLHKTTQWRCGWWLLLLYTCRWLLRHSQRLLLRHKLRSRPTTPPRTPRATTMSAPMLKR